MQSSKALHAGTDKSTATSSSKRTVRPVTDGQQNTHNRRITRQAVHGEAKALYDQRYHPMDDIIAPRQAKTARLRGATGHPSDSDVLVDDEEYPFTSKPSTPSSTGSDDVNVDNDELSLPLQREPDEKAVRRSQRSAAHIYHNYNRKIHPNDRQAFGKMYGPRKYTKQGAGRKNRVKKGNPRTQNPTNRATAEIDDQVTPETQDTIEPSSNDYGSDADNDENEDDDLDLLNRQLDREEEIPDQLRNGNVEDERDMDDSHDHEPHNQSNIHLPKRTFDRAFVGLEEQERVIDASDNDFSSPVHRNEDGEHRPDHGEPFIHHDDHICTQTEPDSLETLRSQDQHNNIALPVDNNMTTADSRPVPARVENLGRIDRPNTDGGLSQYSIGTTSDADPAAQGESNQLLLFSTLNAMMHGKEQVDEEEDLDLFNTLEAIEEEPDGSSRTPIDESEEPYEESTRLPAMTQKRFSTPEAIGQSTPPPTRVAGSPTRQTQVRWDVPPHPQTPQRLGGPERTRPRHVTTTPTRFDVPPTPQQSKASPKPQIPAGLASSLLSAEATPIEPPSTESRAFTPAGKAKKYSQAVLGLIGSALSIKNTLLLKTPQVTADAWTPTSGPMDKQDGNDEMSERSDYCDPADLVRSNAESVNAHGSDMLRSVDAELEYPQFKSELPSSEDKHILQEDTHLTENSSDPLMPTLANNIEDELYGTQNAWAQSPRAVDDLLAAAHDSDVPSSYVTLTP